MKKKNISIVSFLSVFIIAMLMMNPILAQKPKTDTIKKATATKIIEVTTADDIIDSLVEPKLKLKLHKENAVASYYADKFNNRKTASGAKYDHNKFTAAHKKFPFGTKLKVTNPSNKKSVVVTVNDRGPFVKGREIDLSKKAFMMIASNKGSGIQKVTIEIIEE
ncbi:septal ring lytic transglycosylase RlpA family protein [Flavobacterium sp.]|uniref:septal ring lytic transglycosylase RlpA family protein n=1 Tax=Flavobacterium sp. TaxID=239 RepID=UPI002B4B51F9|nr:septal ring lytic transglycosylase RlpA family protein [Flavobacterium sp.]HLP64098.1 septal ring lytic transglycosylase RlpA family protein [Flavobacterium sp.]